MKSAWAISNHSQSDPRGGRGSLANNETARVCITIADRPIALASWREYGSQIDSDVNFRFSERSAQ